MVTVVDAVNFIAEYQQARLLADSGEHLGEDDERTVADLLIDQVEFCDVLVVSKTDLVSKTELDALTAVLRQLNPSARIEYAEHGRVPLDKVLGHRFV